MTTTTAPRGGRLHAPVMTATVAPHPDPHPALDRILLVSPAVGWWRATVVAGQLVQPGELIGELTVLGTVHAVIAGPGARGAVMAAAPGTRRGAVGVGAGTELLALDRSATASAATTTDSATAASTLGGVTVSAPSSGRYYGRPAPGKPAFVAVGDVIREGHTVCLLEVMKTFHRVTFAGPGEARVVAIAVTDEADVNSGDILVHLEAIS